MRSVLMVAYYYPPAGGAGVQRTLKFTRYLPAHGWRPHVLVPRDAAYPVRDPSLAAEIPDEVTVHTSRIIEPYEAYRRFTGRRGDRSLDVATLSRDRTERARPAERVSEWIRSTFFIPDARVLWLPFAVHAGRAVIRRHRPDVLYSTAPPYTTHLIARALHRASGVPWVADFRDSWVDWLSAAKRTGLSRRIELRMERQVLRDASRVLTVSRGVADDLTSRHPALRDDRWLVLPNGFDPSDIAGVEPDRGGAPTTRLLITHAGTLYGPRDPETLVRALEALVEAAHPLATSIRVRFVGRVADRFRDRMARGPARACFEFTGYVDHRRSTALAAGSDAMLLVVDQVPQAAGILTGKLFEYLGLRKPILALAPEGEAADIVRETGAGTVVRPGDVDAMKRQLEAMLAAWQDGSLSGAAAGAVARYRRDVQAEVLAETFDTLGRGRLASP